jgi:hypothetical protein
MTSSASAHVRDPTPKELAKALDARVVDARAEKARAEREERDARRLPRSFEGPERSWKEMWGDLSVCGVDEKDTWRRHCVPRGFSGEELMFQPKWVPSDQPTEHRDENGRYWMKLRL